MITEWQRGEYSISTDRNRLNINVIHQFLASSYWAEGLPLEILKRSIQHSLVFGMYKSKQQVGFARVTTDYSTFAYIADVFVLEPFRGQGLGTWLIETIMSHPELQGLRRWLLITKDAQDFYRLFGFTELKNSDRFLEKWYPNVYTQTD
ncbi:MULTISPECIES: GNAT family N-acetyltransferase [Fischerella]|uniref:N-acetyltransferase n=1 Tax=Fischerella muscicola CCMEE 5323 TaxID=2019572 RepID=A0A2N6K094_FISMU|nr:MULTISPECIES: GNAT family N-acetyltransferase [Fischerella]MBD2434681.1 GNAT family N-acetyltransferase [Fischerella sp. FACHB-380]PLZ87365.1 N-acetyltransferase [Fischerella muscicola CCMEE 5323]